MATVSMLLYLHRIFHYFHTFLPPKTFIILKLYEQHSVLYYPHNHSIYIIIVYVQIFNRHNFWGFHGQLFICKISSSKFCWQIFDWHQLERKDTQCMNVSVWHLQEINCQALTLPVADSEVVSRMVATLLRITTLFNPFCIGQIVDCDNYILVIIWILKPEIMKGT